MSAAWDVEIAHRLHDLLRVKRVALGQRMNGQDDVGILRSVQELGHEAPGGGFQLGFQTILRIVNVPIGVG